MAKKDIINVYEVIELFLTDTVPFIQENKEVPRFNIKFPEEFFDFVKNSIFKFRINRSYIDKLRQMSYLDSNNPMIMVHDVKFFFQSLTDIINSLFLLHQQYQLTEFLDDFHIWMLRRIWLRMGADDFNQVERFLDMQLNFCKINQLDCYQREVLIDNYYGFEVKAQTRLNETYDEATRCMQFKIYDGENSYHSLPNIYYDVLNEGIESVCYIYAIQNDKNKKKISKIERSLYKMNKGINNIETEEYLDYKNGISDYYPENISDVHPSQVLSLLYFVEILNEHEITRIKVPILQVLSYDYHVLLGEKMKDDFEKTWTKGDIEYIKMSTGDQSGCMQDLYFHDKEWYEHVVGKEDLISKNKVETFIRIFRRASFHNSEIEICNEPMLEGDYLDIKLKKSRVRDKIK